ncbi:MAG TPA: flagellin [Sphingomonadaceae bacterium]|nr:flagellin [Sphingomonadaceae bacterium]
MISGTRYQLSAEIARQTQLAQQIARAQSDISTTTRIQAPSDDPAAAARIAVIGRSQANEAVWSTNVEMAAAIASRGDTTLGTVTNAINRALELMTSASTATLNDSDRQAIAVELRGIAQDITAASNEKDSNGNPLFPTGASPRIPVGNNLFVSPTASRAEIFEGIDTPSGPMDMASIINAAADAVVLTDPTARAAATGDALTAVNAASTRITAAAGDQGVRGKQIDAARDRLTASTQALAEERTTLESTDITATVAKLQSMLLSLQAAQTTFARINQASLFDLLS